MRARPFLLLVLAGAAGAFPALQATAAEPCSVTTIGVDTLGAHYGYPYLAPSIFGQANGQSFMATDTLIHSITAWRTFGQDTVIWPVKLWITRNRPDGYPMINEQGILLEGPSVALHK